jgi:hypothetical protein
MEPTPQTYQQIGALCAAWSYLEMQTEKTLRGLLKMDERLARIFIWRLGMRERCSLIKQEASNSLSEENAETLKDIIYNIQISATDRNIIIHGLMHATLEIPSHVDKTKISIPVGATEPIPFARIPCWTIFMGEGKGKSYAVSTEAVSIVLENISKLGTLLRNFNTENGFTQYSEMNNFIEKDWPKRL